MREYRWKGGFVIKSIDSRAEAANTRSSHGKNHHTHTSPPTLASAFLKMAALCVIQASTARGHVADCFADRIRWQTLGDLSQTCDILGPGFTLTLWKLLFLCTHFAGDLFPNRIVKHIQVRTPFRDSKSSDLGFALGCFTFIGLETSWVVVLQESPSCFVTQCFDLDVLVDSVDGII